MTQTRPRIGAGAGALELRALVAAQKRGEPRGIWSVCSAHPTVLEATMAQAKADGSSLLVESTSNQVNPEGGYTGRTPADFVRFLEGLAVSVGFPSERLILGGDHLGPFPWQSEPSERALAKAHELVRQCVLAGYEKIHLDASMACAGDPGGAGGSLDEQIVAERTADLAATAERASRNRGFGEAPVYVVGTEVPTPGGEQEEQASLRPTRPEAARRFLDLARAAFDARGLAEAWPRVIALVVQPGVDFGDTVVHAYEPARARALREFASSIEGIVFEVHSTDYQTENALRRLVEDHFAILKVGPALTFAFREALFALAHLEEQWPARKAPPSGLRNALEEAMRADPRHWRKYYRGDEAELRFARAFSLSDRVRYYWPTPGVVAAVSRLVANLRQREVPLALLSQYLPWALPSVLDGTVANDPLALARLRVRQVAEVYARACGTGGRQRLI
jgi:D-tagatose-1,6-bisphosphate aldolase subunit GatZ/KbaZ